MTEEVRGDSAVDGLPAGWRKLEQLRPKGLRVATGHTEVYYVSPKGAKCANKREMWGMLSAKDRERIDLTQFDWQAGKMLPQVQTKAKRPRLAAGSTAPQARDKPTIVDHTRISSSAACAFQMPVRQSLPFTFNSRQPVTLVRNNTDSERKEKDAKYVNYDDLPRQLFWEKRLVNSGSAGQATYFDSDSDYDLSVIGDTAAAPKTEPRKNARTWPARITPNAPTTAAANSSSDEQHLLVLRSVAELLNEAATRARSSASSHVPLIGQQLRYNTSQSGSTTDGGSGGWTCSSQQNVAHRQAVSAALRDVQQPLVSRISATELNSVLRAEVRRGETRVRRLRRCLQAALEAFGDDCTHERTTADVPASEAAAAAATKTDASSSQQQQQSQPVAASS